MSNDEQVKRRLFQRFAAADFILSELEKGRFPHLTRFLQNAHINLRQITVGEAFEANSYEPNGEDLWAASQTSGGVYVSMKPAPCLSLFYEKELSDAEALLFATSLQKVAALALTAIGLDMSGPFTEDQAMPLSDKVTDKR